MTHFVTFVVTSMGIEVNVIAEFGFKLFMIPFLVA